MSALFQHYLPTSPAMLPYVPGRFYASQHVRAAGNTVPMAADRLYCVPYVLARPGLFAAMAVSVITSATGFLRMALAADNGAGLPGALIEEPLVDADTTIDSPLCPFAQPRWISAGVWWILFCFSGTPWVRGTSTQLFSGGNTLLLGSPAADGGASGGTTGTENGLFAPLTYQAGVPFMPNSPSGLSYLSKTAAPLPTLKAA